MAEGFMRQKLAEQGLDAQHRVASAGVWAVVGRSASKNAVAVMAERGIDISDHVARALTADDVAEADLVLVMSREHLDMIRSTWPQYSWKVHRLAEMSGKRRDIKDPYGGSIQEYQKCADTISDYVDQGLTRIMKLA
jgi:protein-tyrosine-phosphatase